MEYRFPGSSSYGICSVTDKMTSNWNLHLSKVIIVIAFKFNLVCSLSSQANVSAKSRRNSEKTGWIVLTLVHHHAGRWNGFCFCKTKHLPPQKEDRTRKCPQANIDYSLTCFITREEGFKMSTSFAIWPSERYEVSFIAETTFLAPKFLRRNFSFLNLLIVKCYRKSSWNGEWKSFLYVIGLGFRSVCAYDSNTRCKSIIIHCSRDLQVVNTAFLPKI